MNRSKYLRMIAIFELIIFLVGTIIYIINMFIMFGELKNISDNAAKAWTIFRSIIGLVIILVFGPSLYILFSSVADLLDSKETPKTSNEKALHSIATSNLKYSATQNTTNIKPTPHSKFKEGQKVTTKKELEDRDGNEIPKGSSGIVLGIEPNGLIKVDFNQLSSGIEVITRVEENNLK